VSKDDLTDAVAIALASLAVVAQLALAGLLVLLLASLASDRARRALGELRATVAGTELWAAAAVALTATLASLFFSEFADFTPCRLCWFQRIAMYPLAVILPLAAFRRDPRPAVYALPLAAAGALVAIWHIYIEINPDAESCSTSAPCSVKWIDELGYITLPVLALTAFAAILALVLLARSRA
jgi:disulfide bond formation protein DsbB